MLVWIIKIQKKMLQELELISAFPSPIGDEC